MVNEEPLKLRFLGALIEQLGAQMYPSATATVAELISNAWDADAANVWVTIPFGEAWTEDDEIVVEDDGHGMTRPESAQRYLEVGRKRRIFHGERTESGARYVHGRKGIGKLAAFGTARILDLVSLRQDERPVAFRLDYDGIRQLPAGAEYEVLRPDDDAPPSDPDGRPLAHGTRIRLTGLRLKRAITEERFMWSMSRRFAVDQAQMKTFINGVRLERFDMDVQIRFPRDGVPAEDIEVEDGWASEYLDEEKQHKVRWWIGFTEKPLKAEYLRGISVTAKGKMLQRPFMFERSQGTAGQLGQEYIVGEVEADWLDAGTDIEDDLILANRDQLQLEDDRVEDFLDWGRRRLRWALAKRNDIRVTKAYEAIEEPDIVDLIQEFTPTEQRHLTDMAKAASAIGEPTPAEIHDFMLEIINGYKDKAVRELMERIRVEEQPFQEQFWGLVREFSLIDARRTYTLIQARLGTIERLDEAVKGGALEVPTLHELLKEYPWLVDPRWSLLGDEINLEELDPTYAPELDEEGNRLDFLFGLRPSEPAPFDQALVVEIKRGRKADGIEHRVSVGEVDKFHTYVLGVDGHYKRRSSDHPRVTGLMIAENYTEQALAKRRSIETITDPQMRFKTWGQVVEEAKLFHVGWLAVTGAAGQRRRAAVEAEPAAAAPAEVEATGAAPTENETVD